MSLVINHNIPAMQTQYNMNVTNRNLAKSLEKLSSGYKINVAADDPSGLVISEQLRSQISGLQRAVRNSSEASNYIGIAEGALIEMNEILKKMRALAIHSSNNGITSPEQIAANQSEVDSGVQTIERIANTTRYSDQFILNGSKQLIYNRNTVVDDTMDHSLIDLEGSRIDQIFKRQGVKMSVGYTGIKSRYQANVNNMAQRAYLEAESNNPQSQIKDGKLSANQEFILTGSKGSRLFNFSKGTNLGDMVAGINNSRDSTGIGATLIFSSNVRIDNTATGSTTGPTYPSTPATGIQNLNTESYKYKRGQIQVYNANLNNTDEAKVSSVTITPLASEAFIAGNNMDGNGKIYAKVVDKANNIIEWYKDKNCTMMIGKGDDKFFSAANNSGIPGSPDKILDGLYMKLTDKSENLDVYEIALVGQDFDNQKDFSVDGLGSWADLGNSTMSGIDLGVNTSSAGQVFFKYSATAWDPTSGNVTEFKVEAFNDSKMLPDSLVGSSGRVKAHATANLPQPVTVEGTTLPNGKNSGLSLTFMIPTKGADPLPKGETSGSVTFNNLGVRLYATEYGSNENIRMQNKEGTLFYHYRDGDSLDKVMIEPKTTVQVSGRDAQVGLNGAPVITQGLKANITTPDFGGLVKFNAGTLGETSLAVAGHEFGSLYSKATALQGIEENEADIYYNTRRLKPPDLNLTFGANTLVDQSNNPISLYLDVSNLAPAVQAKLDVSTTAKDIKVTYTPATATAQAKLTIDGSALAASGISAFDIPVEPENLEKGFYVQNENLKGLYIKASALVDFTQSKAGDQTGQVTVSNGERMTSVFTYATTARHNTNEELTDFVGGMQFQLGNSEGDQDRTVYSVPSMVIANMGRLEFNDSVYSLQDILSGGVASLAKDPVLAMRVLSKAIDDVSTLRARLGAFQKNMLQTNMNALEIAIENITKTESAIRDTNMAEASTEFTKNQIMMQAGTAMLAQANTISQNVLSLLQ